jgi:S1-C subfamily serine protease
MGIPYGRGFAVIIVTAFVLAFAYLHFFEPYQATSLLPSPHVKITRSDGGHGSGTHLGDGFILTANHVVDKDGAIEVVTLSGDTYKAEIVLQSADTDTAVIRIIGPHKLAVAYTQCRDPAVGELVFARGNPHDLINVQTRGYIARKSEPTWILAFAVIIDMTVAPGMSGGAIQDIRGYIVGFVSATIVGAPLTFAVPPSTFCPLLKEAGAI